MSDVASPSQSSVLEIAATIATAWMAVGFAPQLIRNRPLRRQVTWAAWICIGLLYLGPIDGAAAFLDAIAVTFETFRLSVLPLLKGAKVTGMLCPGARRVLRILVGRLTRSEDISPSGMADRPQPGRAQRGSNRPKGMRR